MANTILTQNPLQIATKGWRAR